MPQPTCPGDDELLRRIDGATVAAGLQVHLEGCAGCRARLARLEAAAQALRRFAAAAVPSNGVGPPPDDPPRRGGTTMPEDSPRDERDEIPGGAALDRQPTHVGKYPVVETLGRGGQGVVYRGLHPALHVDVAIKVGLRPLDAGQVDAGELEREGKALAGLDHPNVVRVHDLDVDAAGRPYLVMELVRGCNLRQHARRVRIAPREAAALVAAAARGAAAGHRKNLTHRDIKPENILIDEAGRPRLIDFGLARLCDAWVTDAGPSGGTLAFMAPEQARGEAVDARGDIFALGGVLYFLLTGKAPFAGRDFGEALDRARRCDFDRAALRAAHVPRRLERICLRAMAADPADRYANADDLAADLERFARPRRRPLAMVALAVALLATVGVAVWKTSGGQDTPPTPPVVAPPPPKQSQPVMSPAAGADDPSLRQEPEPSARMPLIVQTVQVVAPPPQVSPVSPLQITKMEIHLYRQNQRLGRIGVDSFAGRYRDDDVRVQAEFNAPAFCRLIALNPDGTVQFCPPGDEDEPPRQRTELTYPSGKTVFGLTDGVGLQAFVLLASQSPLPSYAEWKSRNGSVPWGTAPVTKGVWQFDGKSFEPLSQSRGHERPLDCPEPFVEACRTLRGRPDIAAIRALAFPVVPSGEHPASQPEPGPAAH